MADVTAYTIYDSYDIRQGLIKAKILPLRFLNLCAREAIIVFFFTNVLMKVHALLAYL